MFGKTHKKLDDAKKQHIQLEADLNSANAKIQVLERTLESTKSDYTRRLDQAISEGDGERVARKKADEEKKLAIESEVRARAAKEAVEHELKVAKIEISRLLPIEQEAFQLRNNLDAMKTTLKDLQDLHDSGKAEIAQARRLSEATPIKEAEMRSKVAVMQVVSNHATVSLVEHQSQTQTLKAELQKLQAALSSQNELLDAKDKLIDEKNKLIDEKNGQLSELKLEVRRSQEEMAKAKEHALVASNRWEQAKTKLSQQEPQLRSQEARISLLEHAQQEKDEAIKALEATKSSLEVARDTLQKRNHTTKLLLKAERSQCKELKEQLAWQQEQIDELHRVKAERDETIAHAARTRVSIRAQEERIAGVKGVIASAANVFEKQPALIPLHDHYQDVPYGCTIPGSTLKAWMDGTEGSVSDTPKEKSVLPTVVAVPHMPGNQVMTNLRPTAARRLEELGVLPRAPTTTIYARPPSSMH